MASIITGVGVPDNTDPRGQNIIPSTNVIRDSVDPNSSETVRSTPPPPPTNQNVQQFFTSAVEEPIISKEDIGKVVIDFLRNTSINGVYPTVAGSTIDFTLPTSTASEQWSQQNWTGVDVPAYTGNVSLPQNNASVFSVNNDSINDSEKESNQARIAGTFSGASDISISKGRAVSDSNVEVANSKGRAVSDSNVEVANSKGGVVSDSNVEIANSKGRSVLDSNIEIANSKGRSVLDSNIEVANSKSKPITDSNIEVANSKSRPVADSRSEVANARSKPIVDSDRRVANPMANSLARRRGNEQGYDVSAVSPILMTSGDKESGMIVYMQGSHAISINPEPEEGEEDVVKDSLSGDVIPPSDYFVSGLPIEFYCYRNGEIGSVTLSAIKRFKSTAV